MICFFCETYWISDVSITRETKQNGKTRNHFMRRCHVRVVGEYSEVCDQFEQAKFYHCKLLNERKTLEICCNRLLNKVKFKEFKKCKKCKQLPYIRELQTNMEKELLS